ncbi:MAG: phosphoglucomutase (alpha-D-glucose-1,6-bisphosphate-dependent) [Candidatus Dormibacter sp.]|uniref:phosphoglucomutase (alpha-D-glucose-1,6-bisphosphate-dependent) n=1 Tax=Candidatus Dormibacter sp. TaxID=2973982 RepID=UPI000DB113CA|nr:MAG: phosphoglucomutase, alpha-D-glucose phosphate-specific [Candidatus Dormibacteraeota bacterium]
MSRHPRAGQGTLPQDLIAVDRLIDAYYERRPDAADPQQRVSFGTSGHRGSAQTGSFNEAHVVAISEAICRHRRVQGIRGQLFLGRDTHALSEPAQRTVIEVLVANEVSVLIDAQDGPTPTPAVSHAILKHNANGAAAADGIVITPSHNPPEDGGLKYNPPNGGPADTEATGWIEAEANRLLKASERIERVPLERALASSFVQRFDFVSDYVDDLPLALDMDAIRRADLRLGVDPLGGASLPYWRAIQQRFGLNLEIVNGRLDPTFSFMTLDHDGRIRMDCSSPDAMGGLVGLKDRFDVAFANDPDADRHGVVTNSAGLLNPNHYLSAAIDYLFRNRSGWPRSAAVGKTLVSSGMIDRVAKGLGRDLIEVPVGFKWFVQGLLQGSLGFGGEESAGASFLDLRGRAWSTDKDGILLALLAAEMTARQRSDPGMSYSGLTQRFGAPVYRRLDAPASAEQRDALKRLSPDQVPARELAGEPVLQVLTRAPGNDAPIGGLKVVTENGWFAARPSGTESIYKIYAESFRGEEHLNEIIAEAQTVVSRALGQP